MIHITFNGSLCDSLKKHQPYFENGDAVVLLQLILEVGEFTMLEHSKINEEIYEIVAGKNAYAILRDENERVLEKFNNVLSLEEICFWVDFDDIKQYLNFVYFIKHFEKFENLYIANYNFEKFYKFGKKIIFDYKQNMVKVSRSLMYFFNEQIFRMKMNEEKKYKVVLNRQIIPVKDEYFDKYIFEVLDEKPKPCQQIIQEIYDKFGRSAATFDQIIIRLSELLKEGIIERVNVKTEHQMFFEFEYKLAGRIDMTRDK